MKVIKDAYERWKDLEWFMKILSIPGLLMFLILMLLVSPIILFVLSLIATGEVLGVDNDD